jgi:hypothetical protein
VVVLASRFGGLGSSLSSLGPHRRAGLRRHRLLGAVNGSAAFAHQMVAVFHLRQFQLGFGRLHPVLDHGRHAFALGKFEALLRNRDGKLDTLCRYRRGDEKGQGGSLEAHFVSIEQLQGIAARKRERRKNSVDVWDANLIPSNCVHLTAGLPSPDRPLNCGRSPFDP